MVSDPDDRMRIIHVLNLSKKGKRIISSEMSVYLPRGTICSLLPGKHLSICAFFITMCLKLGFT